jgi:hypothetical protein
VQSVSNQCERRFRQEGILIARASLKSLPKVNSLTLRKFGQLLLFIDGYRDIGPSPIVITAEQILVVSVGQ